MIPRTSLTCQTPDWQHDLARAIRDPGELFQLLGLDPKLLPAAEQAARDFGLLVPHAFISRMRHGDPDDPLLRQILPLGAERNTRAGYSRDPLLEENIQPSSGLLHKYQGRALLISTAACAVHCRYCFRRHFPYQDASLNRDHWQSALDYLRNNPSIEEIILSGGDPLVLSDRRLATMLSDLEGIPHLQRLRIHTRLPIVLPGRITPPLCEALSRNRLQTVMVIHCNHPQEIDVDVSMALDRLGNSGLTLLNQSVLLRGVNDKASILEDLSKQLFRAGVLPYYLHQLDRVEGASHFEVPDEEALALHAQLSGCLPGYLVPRLVRDEASKSHKSLLTPSIP